MGNKFSSFEVPEGSNLTNNANGSHNIFDFVRNASKKAFEAEDKEYRSLQIKSDTEGYEAEKEEKWLKRMGKAFFKVKNKITEFKENIAAKDMEIQEIDMNIIESKRAIKQLSESSLEGKNPQELDQERGICEEEIKKIERELKNVETNLGHRKRWLEERNLIQMQADRKLAEASQAYYEQVERFNKGQFDPVDEKANSLTLSQTLLEFFVPLRVRDSEQMVAARDRIQQLKKQMEKAEDNANNIYQRFKKIKIRNLQDRLKSKKDKIVDISVWREVWDLNQKRAELLKGRAEYLQDLDTLQKKLRDTFGDGVTEKLSPARAKEAAQSKTIDMLRHEKTQKEDSIDELASSMGKSQELLDRYSRLMAPGFSAIEASPELYRDLQAVLNVLKRVERLKKSKIEFEKFREVSEARDLKRELKKRE